MKKMVLSLLACIALASGFIYASSEYEAEDPHYKKERTKKKVEKKQKESQKKQERREQQQEKKEKEKSKKRRLSERQHQREQEQKERRREVSQHRRQRREERREKNREKQDHQRIKDREYRANHPEFETAEIRAKRREEAKIRRTQERQEKAERKERRELERETKRKQSAEREERCRQREEQERLDREKRIDEMREQEKKRLEDVKLERKERKDLTERWNDFRQVEVRHDYELGCYADLSKQPARPFYASMVPNKYNFQVFSEYTYAVDAYSSEGVNHNITQLAFGEGAVQVQDLLLVSKLAREDKVTPNEIFNGFDDKPQTTDTTSTYLKILSDQQIRFLGKAESWGLNFDLGRYIWERNVFFGVMVPVLYKHNRLRAEMDESILSKLEGLVDVSGGGGGGTVSPNAFMRRYGQDTGKFIGDILRAKGISELGGSALGLGDITVFANASIEDPRLDHLLLGVRLLIPVAKKATTSKLWAPELGNGGFFEGTAFMSIGMYRNWYINPHIFLQMTFSGQAHQNKRVPKRVTQTNADDKNPAALNKGSMSFADRVLLVAPAAGSTTSFNEFDTTRPGLADNVASIKVAKGPEFNVRVGNVIEKFILRRAFLDVFYDFRAKLVDRISGLNITDWNPDIYKTNTQQIDHKAGIQWSYQFDAGSRLYVGMDYSFSGRNVAKQFAAQLYISHSF